MNYNVTLFLNFASKFTDMYHLSERWLFLCNCSVVRKLLLHSKIVRAFKGKPAYVVSAL